jgi:PPK2 family polyphosphate:nucleotide phosphotransferase
VNKNKVEKELQRYRAVRGDRFDLSQIDPAETHLFGKDDKDKAHDFLAGDEEALRQLQRVLYAEQKHALLIILQGMDTSGKDGTIRHVMGPLNPQGVKVVPFKRPSLEELAHDYLWRVHRETPRRGEITIFNRSHYEDIIVPSVWHTVPDGRIEERYAQVNEFERHLAQNDTTILKFFLHISRNEQRERLQARLDQPHKRWKFEEADLDARAKWDELTAAYERILGRCHHKWAPWYVIPADRKWYRNAIVARIIRYTLEGLDLRYPEPKIDPDTIVLD